MVAKVWLNVVVIGLVAAVSFYLVVEAVPAAVNCDLPTGSPQLAQICRLGNQSANSICDADCRCVMGARAGGKCANNKADNKTYCLCDYTSPATNSPVANLCTSVNLVGICNNSIPIIGGILNNTICNADCQCSHGYPNTGTHMCSSANGVAGNTNTFCVCNKAQTNSFVP